MTGPAPVKQNPGVSGTKQVSGTPPKAHALSAAKLWALLIQRVDGEMVHSIHASHAQAQETCNRIKDAGMYRVHIEPARATDIAGLLRRSP